VTFTNTGFGSLGFAIGASCGIMFCQFLAAKLYLGSRRLSLFVVGWQFRLAAFDALAENVV
jgi:hypothetical protein